MKIVPYEKGTIELFLSKEEICNRIKDSLTGPSWKIEAGKFEKNKHLEGGIEDDNFVIGYGSYALSYGKFSPGALLFGKVLASQKQQECIVLKLEIRPSFLGLVLSFLVMFLSGVILFIGFNHGDFSNIFTGLFFLSFIYIGTMVRFNRNAKIFDEYLTRVLREVKRG